MASKDPKTQKMLVADAGSELPAGLGRPALRALAAAGIHDLATVARAREEEIAALHGVGPRALEVLRRALREAGTGFAKEGKAAKGGAPRLEGILEEVLAYHEAQAEGDRAICELLAQEIHAGLPGAEHKIWHRHPVWFLEQNPIAGYSKLKGCVRLLFWSGQSFDEPGLAPEGTFKAAEARYRTVDDVDTRALRRWLKKARAIQWDYRNLIKRKGRLERLS